MKYLIFLSLLIPTLARAEDFRLNSKQCVFINNDGTYLKFNKAKPAEIYCDFKEYSTVNCWFKFNNKKKRWKEFSSRLKKSFLYLKDGQELYVVDLRKGVFSGVYSIFQNGKVIVKYCYGKIIFSRP